MVKSCFKCANVFITRRPIVNFKQSQQGWFTLRCTSGANCDFAKNWKNQIFAAT